MKKALFLALVAICVMAFASTAFAAAPTVIAADGGSVWSYQDSHDSAAKRQGGYALFNDSTVSTWYADDGASYSIGGGAVNQADFVGKGPHGGYDTSTNKCKVCHAVHRAEGTYYLLRANSSDDACTYCHIGGSAHSDRVVYTGNAAGIDTPNGHTMGASSRIPDSSVRSYTTTVAINTTVVKVRNYESEMKQLNRVMYYGRSPIGHPAYSSGALTFGEVGPTPLSCSNCHQVHNAKAQIWQPPAYVDGYNNPSVTRLTAGYKLLRRFPGASIVPGNEAQAGTTAIAKVPESTLIADVNYSTNASFEATYVDSDAAGQGDKLTWRQPDWVVGSSFASYHANVTQYQLSVWCADCHNLNIANDPVTAGTSELGFQAVHAERSHPVPASRGFDCYACHRSGMSSASGCNRCHYSPQNYATDAGLALSYGEVTTASAAVQAAEGFNRPTDFPHAGANDEYKLLGAYSLATLPVGDGTFTKTNALTTITADNLDAVCLRCHTDQGTHQ